MGDFGNNIDFSDAAEYINDVFVNMSIDSMGGAYGNSPEWRSSFLNILNTYGKSETKQTLVERKDHFDEALFEVE